MKPRWMRTHIACPDCGQIIDEENAPRMKSVEFGVKLEARHFDCPRCGVHYTAEDFWKEHEFKTSREALV